MSVGVHTNKISTFNSCVFVYDLPEEAIFAANQEDSCSSSSIGRNSDGSGASSFDENGEDREVQSCYKGPLDTMDSLEDSLPVRRGISKCYEGKSKSFTSLADASCSSSISKPTKGFIRKRKSFLMYWDRNHLQRSGISKRPASSKCDLPPVYPHGRKCANSSASSRPHMNFASWRSLSLSDLRCLARTGLAKSNGEDQRFN